MAPNEVKHECEHQEHLDAQGNFCMQLKDREWEIQITVQDVSWLGSGTVNSVFTQSMLFSCELDTDVISLSKDAWGVLLQHVCLFLSGCQLAQANRENPCLY